MHVYFVSVVCYGNQFNDIYYHLYGLRPQNIMCLDHGLKFILYRALDIIKIIDV